ncbi:MAG: hypothetical protein BRC29_01265 [Nanohaloarchaea archaeon SW_7_43_1]|nr:MAG: hypothetical protein BRC29_01265 [Nanohaloarchaea archaeon SW_7_43_1]
MNQTLTLIVAASVLMMTALTVILMSSDTLPQVQKDVEVTACQEAVSVQCSTSDSPSVPANCKNDEGQVPEDVASQIEGLSVSGLSCEPYN